MSTRAQIWCTGVVRAVLYRLCSLLRERMVTTVGLSATIAVVVGVVVAFAAGAQRTSTVADR